MLNVIMLNVIMLNVIMVRVVLLNVIILSVVLLIVMAPRRAADTTGEKKFLRVLSNWLHRQYFKHLVLSYKTFYYCNFCCVVIS